MKQVKITNKNGLHARPASLVTSIALEFPGNVYLEKKNTRCNAKNIMSVMELELVCGDVINVIACGEGSDKVEKEIEKAIKKLKE